MAQSKQTPQDFIKNCFTPQIAVICSPLAEQQCRKNNLSFIEMVQPFCKLSSEVYFKDSMGASVPIRNLKVTLVDINARPPTPTLARRYLNSSVSEVPDTRYQKYDGGDIKLDIPQATPWFEAWRDTFFQVQFPSDHEFTKHYLACILVVSSLDANPSETMTNLIQSVNYIMQDSSPTKLPKWFNNRILRYYVLLHENLNGNNVSAVECYDSMRQAYGKSNCFLLRINSRSSTESNEQLPDPWSQFLSTRLPVSYEKETPESSPSVERAMSASWEKASIDSSSLVHPLSPENEETSIGDSESGSEIEDPKQTNLHGGCLSTEDVEQIKLLVLEFCTKALIPYVEREIQQLSDFVTNKRVSRSLLSATKRWFTPSKSGSNSVSVNTLIYSEDAAELQIRRLADLYFMFGNYNMAYQSYHSAKKEYQNDQAWLYYAGTLEMAGLSAFMCNESSRKIVDNFEEGIITYLNICKLAQFATRATLLSTECMKSRGLFGEAAQHLIRMTSEESDLRSALLLEQACYCFLQCVKPLMVRKYAFHMVLAGHRFSKAAQKKHALRCYKQAAQVYQNKGWNLAEDHVNYTIGKQANNLNLLEEAVSAFALMLSAKSKQNPQQQEIFLKEYLSTHIAFAKSQNAILTPILPLPLLHTNATKVLVEPSSPLSQPGKVPALGVRMNSYDSSIASKWLKLEEMLVVEAQNSLPMIFKPLTTLFTKGNTAVNPVGIVGEPIQVSVTLQNPLEISLVLKEIYLLWQYKDKTNRFAANEIMGNSVEYMKTQTIKSFTLLPNCTQEVILAITPLAIGEVVLKGVCYLLCCQSSDLCIKGKQNFFPQEKSTDVKDTDVSVKRFVINIVPPAPCLQVYFEDIETNVLRGQLQQVTVEFRNVSSIPLHKVYMATTVPELLSTSAFQKSKFGSNVNIDLSSPAAKEKEARKNHVTNINLPNGRLEPGQCHTLSLCLKTPDVSDQGLVDILIYYESIVPGSTPSYRLVKHTWDFKIQESINIECKPERSSHSQESDCMNFAIKLQNLNKVSSPQKIQMNLLNTALLSNYWILMDEVITCKNQTIRYEESEHIYIRAKRKISSEPNYSEITLSKELAKNKISNDAYLDFAQRLNQFRINIFEDCDNINRNLKKEAIVMVRWQAQIFENEETKVALGQSLAVIKSLEETLEVKKEEPKLFSLRDSVEVKKIVADVPGDIASDTQITYYIVHPKTVNHNFSEKKICTVGVQLVVHSISNSNLTVIIDALDTTCSNIDLARSVLVYPNSSNNFRWIKSGKIVRQIEPFSTVFVTLNMAVFEPGTYDMGARLSISAHLRDKPEDIRLQKTRIESSLVISNDADTRCK